MLSADDWGAFWAVATRRVAVLSTTLRSVAIKKAKSFVTWLFSFTDKRTSCWLSQKSLERPGAREFGCTIVDPSSNLEPIGRGTELRFEYQVR